VAKEQALHCWGNVHGLGIRKWRKIGRLMQEVSLLMCCTKYLLCASFNQYHGSATYRSRKAEILFVICSQAHKKPVLYLDADCDFLHNRI